MTSIFDGLDDPFDPPAADALEQVAGRVARMRRRRRVALASGVALVLVAALAVTAVALPDDDNDTLETVAPSTTEADETTTTRAEAITTTSALTTPTTADVVAPPPTAAPTTTLPEARRDWSSVHFNAPGGFDISTGDEVTFDWTMYNEGEWPVVIDNGCPWYLSWEGASLACSAGVPARLEPGASISGTATFTARLPLGDGDWQPTTPALFYVIGLLQDQYVFDDVTGGNGRAAIGINVLNRDWDLSVGLEPAALTLPVDGQADVVATLRNDTTERQWDWACSHLTAPIPDVMPETPPPPPLVVNPVALDGDVACAGRGWREPGWSTTVTLRVSAQDLSPGDYHVYWSADPQIAIELTVVEPD